MPLFSQGAGTQTSAPTPKVLKLLAWVSQDIWNSKISVEYSKVHPRLRITAQEPHYSKEYQGPAALTSPRSLSATDLWPTPPTEWESHPQLQLLLFLGKIPIRKQTDHMKGAVSHRLHPCQNRMLFWHPLPLKQAWQWVKQKHKVQRVQPAPQSPPVGISWEAQAGGTLCLSS